MRNNKTSSILILLGKTESNSSIRIHHEDTIREHTEKQTLPTDKYDTQKHHKDVQFHNHHPSRTNVFDLRGEETRDGHQGRRDLSHETGGDEGDW